MIEERALARQRQAGTLQPGRLDLSLALLMIAIFCNACGAKKASTTEPVAEASVSLPYSCTSPCGNGESTCTPPCNLGDVRFELMIEGDLGRFCSDVCVPWIGIADEMGAHIPFWTPDLVCHAKDCCSGRTPPCPGIVSPMCGPQPLMTSLQTVWNGSTLGQSTLADAALCNFHGCLGAGKYVASMCLFENADAGACDVGMLPTKCVQVPFDFPTDTVVRGTLMP
jgi:hypothetical protein